MRKTNTTAVRGEASVLLSVLRLSYRLFVTFLPKKQRLSPAKNFNSLSVCDENKSLRGSALSTKTSVNFPPENSLCPREWGSQIDRGDTRETPWKHTMPSLWLVHHASLGAAAPASCVNSQRFVFKAEMLRSVRITIFSCVNEDTKWFQAIMLSFKLTSCILFSDWRNAGCQRLAVLLWPQLWSPTPPIWESWSWVETSCRIQEWSFSVLDWRVQPVYWRLWGQLKTGLYLTSTQFTNHRVRKVFVSAIHCHVL